MKDKYLRKALGMHDDDENLCGCDLNPNSSWTGEIPMLWRRLKELERKVEKLEKPRGNQKKKSRGEPLRLHKK